MNRRPGAPKGNQNARKHGFYSSVMTEKERTYLNQAALVKGLDSEINILRAKIKSIVENDPTNVRLISLAALSLARLLKAGQKLEVKQSKSEQLETAIKNVIRNVAIPLGAGDYILQRQEELRKEEEEER